MDDRRARPGPAQVNIAKPASRGTPSSNWVHLEWTGASSWKHFWISTGVMFLAGLGDKSQLMAMTFATRFKARTVLLGITIAKAVVHAA